jgi:hypothetical protein
LINEVSIHTLQTARFSKEQMIQYMQGKCLFVDSFPTDQYGQLFFYPVLICGIPGKLSTHDPDKPFPDKYLYDFITSLDFIDTTCKELDITLPSSITSISALYDTLGHRVHTFGASDNDSIALYWHGIDFVRLHGSQRLELPERVEIAIKDSTEWSKKIPNVRRMYEERGMPMPKNIEN